ncbi:hypothetical protein B0H15DRAFT_932996 [Mycena belliarum]|uniref:Uncharacterized protein n=1 Tax=Mycena belliarum TaxID=1033014 RepID=A0AAD6XIG2_9AGAR|nr:hypothetical protein B0H15DRAFT_932996 [Mycena belliae]
MAGSAFPQPSLTQRHRRNAVDYGSGGADFTTRMAAHVVQSHRSAHRIVPVPHVTMPPPSEHALHHYTLMNIRSKPWGNVGPWNAPPLGTCAECCADALIYTMRKRLGAHLYFPPRGPAPSKTSFIPLGASLLPNPSGALVRDVLAFKEGCVASQMSSAFVRSPTPGPVPITLRIEGHPPVDDIIYASCVHRDITAVEFAWWASQHLRTLAEYTLHQDSDRLELLWLHTEDGIRWTAHARFRH